MTLVGLLYIIGIFLAVSVTIITCGRFTAMISLRLLRNRSKRFLVFVDSIAFAVGSIVGAVIAFMGFCVFGDGGGFAVEALILTLLGIALVETVLNVGITTWNFLRPDRALDTGWKTVALLGWLPILFFVLIMIEGH